MIEKIGPKRALIVAILFGVLIVAGLFSQFVLTPQAEKLQTELNAAQGTLSKLKGDIVQMQSDYSIFESHKVLYDNIKKVGFFNNQDRIIARERFNTIQQLSKVISAKYEIKGASVAENDATEKTGYVMLESPITLSLSAMDDLDIYRFIYFLNYGFPGHITINNLVIDRNGEASADNLKKIGSGGAVELVTAKLDLTWRTMARKDEIAPESIAAPNAGVQTGGAPPVNPAAPPMPGGGR